MTLDARDDGRSLVVTYDGRQLVHYVYDADDPQLESPRPYAHPIRTLGGSLVSVYRPWDHVWHKGLSWSLPHLGHDNFWGGPTFSKETGYRQLDNNGAMRHRTVESLDADPDKVRLRHTLTWVTEQGKHVVDESRSVTVTVADDAWVLVFDTTMTNVSGERIMIGSPTTAGRENAGYGGLFWRGPRPFTAGSIHSPEGSGGDELRGRRAEWMGFTGQHDEDVHSSTLVMVDSTANPAHPPQWFVRSENFAGLCPAPFFSEELPFDPDQPLRFRYAFVVADGDGDDGRAAALATVGRTALRS